MAPTVLSSTRTLASRTLCSRPIIVTLLHDGDDPANRPRRAIASSLAAALLFIVQALPWLVIVVPVLWGVWKGLRRLAVWRRARRAASESA